MEELLQVKSETNWYNFIFKYCLLILYFFTILNKLLLLQLNFNILCNFKVEMHWCHYNWSVNLRKLWKKCLDALVE